MYTGIRNLSGGEFSISFLSIPRIVVHGRWYYSHSLFISPYFFFVCLLLFFSLFLTTKTIYAVREHWWGVLPEECVLQLCCKYSGAYMCVGAISIKLQSSFVEIAPLHCCSPVGLLHVCRPLEDCFWIKITLCTIFNLFFLMNYTFEDFKVSVLL